MNTIAAFALVAVALFFPAFSSSARPANGSFNTDEVPTLPLAKALSPATKALAKDVDKFVCTLASSKTAASGGGWKLIFQSRTLVTRIIVVDENGKVIAIREASPKGGQIEKTPTIRINKATKIAVRKKTGKGPREVICALWDWDTDEWTILLGSADQESDLVVVDSEGRIKGHGPKKQK